MVLRKRPDLTPSAQELERVDTGDQREWAALRQQAGSALREAAWRTAQLQEYAESRSWRLTKPLRRIGARLRQLRGQKTGVSV
ncbi:MAG: hypothetical protein M3Z95_05205 [Actinomycetota bacterium]|nr:hypothetical protein [Actinomycetota bacterium]